MIPALIKSLCLAVIVSVAASWPATAQTPIPLAEWQLSAGEVLAPLAGPVPDWRVVTALGFEVAPTYPGAKRTELTPSGILDIRYRDIAFASDGEGLGINLLRGKTYRAGFALSYDMGRNTHDDPRLVNLPNVNFAAEPKLFAQYFLEPVVLTADLRRAVGGYDGFAGDLGAYVPLPLAKTAFLFVGPTVAFADRKSMRAYFGIDAAHAEISGLRPFAADGGLRDAGFGATAVWLLGDHWLLNADTAYQRLLGDAASSPITETKNQFVFIFNAGYRF